MNIAKYSSTTLLSAAQEEPGLSASVASVSRPCCTFSVPQELREMIWAYLPMRDCFGVAQVCREWRACALSSSRLWRNVDFFAKQHPDGCACGCKHYDKSGPPIDTNLVCIRTVLSRSSSLPLSLNINILGLRAHGAAVLELSRVLQPHAARIREMCIATGSSHAVPQIFSSCSSFPALRRLTCKLDYAVVWGGHDKGSFFWNPFELPCLEYLDVFGSVAVDGQRSFSLPCLHTLRCTFLDPADILIYVQNAPRLKAVTVECVDVSFPDGDPTVLAAVRNALAGVDTVEAVGLVPETEGPILDMLAASSRRNLALNYDTLAIAVDAYDTLRDLQAPVQLSFERRACEPKYHAVTVSDQRGLTRTLSSECGSLWDNSELLNIIELAGELSALEWGLTDCLFEFATLSQPQEHLRTMVIHWADPAAIDYQDLTEWASSVFDSSAHHVFPALETLCIDGRCRVWHDTLRVPKALLSVTTVRVAITHLVSGRKLPILELRHVTLEGDVSLLHRDVTALFVDGQRLGPT
ncbi:hypothetical protein EXIGLDRAFT_773865 [Exidia glandulosa HHB12029]|uniref:F-box domain-containing protein n=1 Tax=Exidia glandulosa HHB12029 TaxID=1314781 RepID=A0A165ZZR0_EXIGL|nr:hypothetical protein EXIGLDRAFT_773865 [Exidia glandulosa HHB12029]